VRDPWGSQCSLSPPRALRHEERPISESAALIGVERGYVTF
jgi:hypothetical protein